MFIFTNRDLETLTTADNDFPDALKIDSDSFNENLETGTCMLEATILKNTADIALVDVGCFVIAIGYKNKPVLLEITEISEDGDYKNIIAEDCGLDLLNEDIGDMELREATIDEYVALILGDNSDWEIGINELGKSRSRTLKYEGTTTKTKRLAQIAGRFDCEISYDVEIKGNVVSKKLINFQVKRGKETGVRLEVGKEVKNIKRSVSITDLCTAVRPIGQPHKEKIAETKIIETVQKENQKVESKKEDERIAKFMEWLKSREGKVKYSQAKRQGPNYYDCSSAITSAAKFAGFIPQSEVLATTGTLWNWGNSGKYFHQIKESEIRYGDIFVSRYNGAGHTGAIIDYNTIIHCTLWSSYNGIVTTKRTTAWMGQNARYYRFNGVNEATNIKETSMKGSYWSESDITKHNLAYKLNTLKAEQLNNWVRAKNPSSPFNGQGAVFMEAEKEAGLDARYILAHAALESGWGTSRIAKTYHNYFGINAYDSNPDNASKSSNPSFKSGIINGAKWIRENYYDKGQKNLYQMIHDPSGNGHNYATDPNWATKIANIMKGSEKFTIPATQMTTIYGTKTTYKEVEMATNLVGYEHDDGRFYVTTDGLICDREAAKEWTRFNKKGKYYTRIYDSQATSQKTLFDEGLRFLQNNNTPKINYEVPLEKLPDELEIGDYVRIIDHNFKPELYLSARLVDITRSLTDKRDNTAKFSNFKQEEKGLAERLSALEKKAREQVFDWESIPYVLEIRTSAGNVFKDGLIETELQASLTRMGIDQTPMVDYFTWERVSEYKDIESYDKEKDTEWKESHKDIKGNILAINNSDVDLQADFICSGFIDDVVVATGTITIKDLTIGIYKQADEPNHDLLSWGDVWQSSDEKSKKIWKGDHWEDVIVKHDLDILNESLTEVSSSVDKAVDDASSALENANNVRDRVSKIDYEFNDAKYDIDMLKDRDEAIIKGLDGKANADTLSEIQSKQQEIEVLLSQKVTEKDLESYDLEMEKQKNYLESVKNALESDALSLQDRISIIEAEVGAGKLSLEAISTYLNFGEEGVIIGKSNNPVKMRLINDRLEFIDGDKVVAAFGNSQANITNLKVTGVFEFGYHLVEKLDTNNRKYTVIRGV